MPDHTITRSYSPHRNMADLKPFQVGVLIAFGVLAIIGLFFFANFKGFGPSAADIGSVTIWGTIPAKDMNEGLRLFKDAHKEYAKVTYVEKQAATFEADLASAIASGTGPDLILINQEHLEAEKSRVVIIPTETIPDRTFRDTYLPAFDIYKTGEGTYGVPLLIDPMVLYVSRTMLASAGIVSPPTTWEAVTGMIPRLTQTNDAQTIAKSGIALGTYGNIEHARSILSLLFLQSGSTITAQNNLGVRSTLLSSGKGEFGMVGAESALNFYVEFANPLKSTYSWNRSFTSARKEFVEGDAALYLGYASEERGLRAANPNLDFDMAPVPQLGTASSRVVYGKTYAFAIPKASRNKEGGLATALALTKTDALPQLARATGMAPGVRAFLVPKKDDLYEAVFYPEALVTRGWLSPIPGATDAVFAAMIENVNSGRMGVKEALVAAEQALNAALAQ